MQKSENKPYALIAGLCYGICGLYSIIVRVYEQSLGYGYAFNTAQDIVFWMAMIGMAVSLFLKNEKAVVAAAGVNALFNLYNFIDYFNLGDLFWFIAYAVVVVLVLLTLEKGAAVQKVWFVSAVVLLLGCLINWIGDGDFSYTSATRMSMLFSLVEVGGLLLIGLWAKDHDFTLPKVELTNEHSKFDPHAVYSASQSDTAIGGADKLRAYSELLESGAITQEEFDAKKKQILGLKNG